MGNTSEKTIADVERIVNDYGDMLYRLCVLMLKNESDAEDVVQEVIIKYFQKTPSFESMEHEKAWLIRVSTNKCRDVLRFRTRHPQIAEDLLDNFLSASMDSANSGILEALTKVPEKYRLVLTLYYVEDYPIVDIAKIIKKSSSAVKMRLQKGRKLLEKIYKEEY